MAPSENAASLKGFFLKSVIILAAFGILRYFLKSVLNPVGVPVLVGSMLSSMTIVLIIVTILLFAKVGRNADGGYWTAAGWFAGLAIWYQLLVVGGILLTERTGADTYYTGPWESMHARFSSPAAHAVSHVFPGMPLMIIMGWVVGAVVFFIARRSRASAAPQPGA